jgi:hypothetical protein
MAEVQVHHGSRSLPDGARQLQYRGSVLRPLSKPKSGSDTLGHDLSPRDNIDIEGIFHLPGDFWVVLHSCWL